LTECDVKLYSAIIRFIPVNGVNFKSNWRTIRGDCKCLHLCLRKLYWNHKEFSATTHFNHMNLL